VTVRKAIRTGKSNLYEIGADGVKVEVSSRIVCNRTLLLYIEFGQALEPAQLPVHWEPRVGARSLPFASFQCLGQEYSSYAFIEGVYICQDKSGTHDFFPQLLTGLLFTADMNPYLRF